MVRRSILSVMALVSVMSGHALAQSCAAPIFFPSNSSVSGDTCAGANELGTLCIFGQSPSNDIIYSMVLVPGYVATSVYLTNNTPAWNAALVLVQGACNGNSLCPRNADAGGAGANETLDISVLAPGNYFLVVTSTPSETSCGAYQLSVNGDPVELQSFEIL